MASFRAPCPTSLTVLCLDIEELVHGGVRVDTGEWSDTALCVAIRRRWPDDVVNILLNDAGNRTCSERFLRLLVPDVY